MPTFYDPIELEDIDIDDATAKFYLIKLPNEAGFKFCATTQNLDSTKMKYDPITRIKEYWPITREQLTQGDFTLLFPEGTIRTEPFKNADDVNEAFHFDPPFDPNSQTSRFGQRADVYRSTGRVGEMFSNNRLTSEEIADLTQIQQARIADFIRRDDVPTHIVQELADQATQTRTTNQSLGPVESRYPHNLPQEPADLMQQAISSGLDERQLATIRYHTLRINTCVNAISEGLLSFQDFLNMDQQIIYGVSCLILNKPAVIAALRDHTITMQDFDDLNIDQISSLGRIALTHQSCITAIADGRTTIAQLADLGFEELEQAVETDTYPQHGMQLR